MSVSQIKNKDGSVSYKIIVSLGRDQNDKQIRYCTNWKVPDNMPQRSIEKALKKKELEFEEQCRNGSVSGSKQTFAEYAEYVISLKERDRKSNTIAEYRHLMKRITPNIGYMTLSSITPKILNNFYIKLGSDGMNLKNGKKLSSKTIIEYHRFISTVFEQANKEMIVQNNPAKNATPPKITKHKANYFQPDQIGNILSCADNEPLKRRLLVYILTYTGCRRGEVLGIKWDKINYDNQSIKIDTNLLYTEGKGVYSGTLKTEASNRTVFLPGKVFDMLRQYRAEYLHLRMINGDQWKGQEGFIFIQDNGLPIHPASITPFLQKFAQKNSLPQLNAHAFRHTAASLAINAGVDIVTVSHMLGHAQPSTTADIYAHLIKGAEEKAFKSIENAINKKQDLKID